MLNDSRKCKVKRRFSEGIAIKGATDSSGKPDMAKTSQEMANSGIDPNKVKVEFNGTAFSSGDKSDTTQSVTETIAILSKRQLTEIRRKMLKENSSIHKVSDVFKNLI